MTRLSLKWLGVCATLAWVPATHAAPVEILVRDAGERDSDGAVLIELRLLNDESTPQSVPLPDRVEARVGQPGETRSVWLERGADLPSNLSIPAGGFVRAHYRFRVPADLALDGADIAIPAWNTRATEIALRTAPQSADVAAAVYAALRTVRR